MGTKAGQELTLCVEAPQWQPALQKARALRGDNGALSNFSIELLDEGYRAINPMARLRYIVKRAPDSAPLTNGSGVETHVSQLPNRRRSQSAPSLRPSRPRRPSRRRCRPGRRPSRPNRRRSPKSPPPPRPPPTRRTRSTRSTSRRSLFGRASQGRRGRPEPRGREARPRGAGPADAAKARPAAQVRRHRQPGRQPQRSSPLTYREYVYAVAQGTSEDDAQRLIAERFGHVYATLDPSAPASSCASRSSITSSRATRSAARSSR